MNTPVKARLLVSSGLAVSILMTSSPWPVPAAAPKTLDQGLADSSEILQGFQQRFQQSGEQSQQPDSSGQKQDPPKPKQDDPKEKDDKQDPNKPQPKAEPPRNGPLDDDYGLPSMDEVPAKRKIRKEHPFDPNGLDVEVGVSVVDEQGIPVADMEVDSKHTKISQHFRLSEDDVPQTIKDIDYDENTEMTFAMMLEWRNLFTFATLGYYADYFNWEFLRSVAVASANFVQNLDAKDQVGAMKYSFFKPQECEKKPAAEQEACRDENKKNFDHMLISDFTLNKASVFNDLMGNASWPTAQWHEANLYDSLIQLIKNLKATPGAGRKAIVLLSTGIDTFSNTTLNDAYRAAKEGHIAIYTLNTGYAFARYLEDHGGVPEPGTRGDIGGTNANRMDFTSGDNTLRFLAQFTGGLHFAPASLYDFPGDFEKILDGSKSQFILTYRPTDITMDGKQHKLKVELLGDDGRPLVILDPHDKKGKKKLKYHLIAPEVRTAPKL